MISEGRNGSVYVIISEIKSCYMKLLFVLNKHELCYYAYIILLNQKWPQLFL
jgi:hypothetical protein